MGCFSHGGQRSLYHPVSVGLFPATSRAERAAGKEGGREGRGGKKLMCGGLFARWATTFHCSLLSHQFSATSTAGKEGGKEGMCGGEGPALFLSRENLISSYFLSPSLPPSNPPRSTFVNYSQYKFGWNVAQSSASLCLIFIFTALFPRLLLPLFGIRRAIQ